MSARTPTDAMPYYCVVCHAGFGEYMACEEVDCLLERPAAALARARDSVTVTRRAETEGLGS